MRTVQAFALPPFERSGEDKSENDLADGV